MSKLQFASSASVIAKLKMLLQEAYGVKTIHIAFRVSITLPGIFKKAL